jgi:molybdopterin converting factor small subunit
MVNCYCLKRIEVGSNKVYNIVRVQRKNLQRGFDNTMKITVKLFASLRDFGPEIQERSVPDRSTVAMVVSSLRLPEDIPLLTVVNGVHTGPHSTLQEGDVLALFPPVGGG